jgi:uncharacterized protein (DUF4415 family)
MAAPAEKKRRRASPAPGRTPSTEAATGHAETGPASIAEEGLAEVIQQEAGPAFSQAWRRVRGLNVPVEALPEKEKVSITLDRSLVDQIRAQFQGRALSTSINELLYAALAQERLGQLVDEMEHEAGPASPEAYERVLAQWFAGD